MGDNLEKNPFTQLFPNVEAAKQYVEENNPTRDLIATPAATPTVTATSTATPTTTTTDTPIDTPTAAPNSSL